MTRNEFIKHLTEAASEARADGFDAIADALREYEHETIESKALDAVEAALKEQDLTNGEGEVSFNWWKSPEEAAILDSLRLRVMQQLMAEAANEADDVEPTDVIGDFAAEVCQPVG